MERIIRDYEDADYDQLVDLMHLPFKARGVSKDEFLKDLTGHPSAAIDLKNDRIRILESEERRVVGCYRYTKWPRESEDTTQAHLFDIDVLPEFQGKGFGRALMLDLLEELRKEGYTGVYSRTTKNNTSSINLHLKCGFTNFREDEDSILWERSL